MKSELTVKVGADIEGLQKEMRKASGELNSFNSNVGKLGAGLAAAFSADVLLDFGKEIFETTAKFQRFEAVLTNTLGSNSEAKKALEEITDFAARTPFQVDELTESFVKLVNQGFKPTMREMTSLGDLAASQGKSFNQLTEAIIDAQTGEFERLKEFGIRASKEGNKVSFTFKGVKEQVDFTSDSIREYILSLGQAQGVSGGMAAISETLGGKMSNFNDAIDQLYLALGQVADKGGAASKSIDLMTASVQGLTNVAKSDAFKEWVDVMTVQIFGPLVAAAAGFEWLHQKVDEFQKSGKGAESTWESVTPPADAADKIKKVSDELIKLRQAIGFRVEKQQPAKESEADFFDPDFDPTKNIDLKSSINSSDVVAGIVEEIKVNEQLAQSLIYLDSIRQKSLENEQKAALQMEQNIALTQQLGEVIGSALVGLQDGQTSIAQVLSSITNVIVDEFQRQALAAIIAKAAITGKDPFAAIAIATIGFAAIKSLFAKIGSSGGGSGGGASDSSGGHVGNAARGRTQEVEVYGKISGDSIAISQSKNSYKRRRTG